MLRILETKAGEVRGRFDVGFCIFDNRSVCIVVNLYSFMPFSQLQLSAFGAIAKMTL